MYRLKDKERQADQTAALKRVKDKRQRLVKAKVSAAKIVELVEKRTRVTQAAAAEVLNAAQGGEVISLQLRPSAVEAVEKTLDALLSK
jgi:hypothetical protein